MIGSKDDRRLAAAKRRVEDLAAFYWHLAAYLLASTLMIWQDIAGGDGLNWAYWAFIPWGIGLLVHALAVFLLTPQWEDRNIQELVGRDKVSH